MSTTETLNAKEWLYENYPELTRRLELNTLRNDVVRAMEEFATNVAEQFLAVEREAVGEQVNPEEKCDADTHIYYKLKLNKPLCPKCRHGF